MVDVRLNSHSTCCHAVQPNFVGPDDTTYTALISAFAKCGDVGSAARYLVEMAESVYTPSLGLLVRRQRADCLPACCPPSISDALNIGGINRRRRSLKRQLSQAQLTKR